MNFAPPSALDVQITELHLAQIADHVVNWVELAPYFSILTAEEEEIRYSHPQQYNLQKRKMLWKWLEKNGKKGTYLKMANIFKEAGKHNLADKVEEIFSRAQPEPPQNVLSSFKQYLKDCYTIAASTLDDNEWPQLIDAPFVHPKLHISDSKEEVSLEDLLKGSRAAPRVLLEGVAGCGKTTVASYVCQQWAKGNMFQEVDLLIHLTLADPIVQSAQSLQDLIPHPSADMRSVVAEAIKKDGKGCCFVMDGWEDLPEQLPKASLIYRLLGQKPRDALRHCSFIITSRPIASVSVKPLVNKTVELTGFSAENVNLYATQYLTQLNKDPNAFISALDDNHHIRGLSSLPINAAILLHLFLILGTGLPSTQMELFKSFIINLLLHHLRVKTDYIVHSLRQFSDLPDDIKSSFDKLCHISYLATFNISTTRSTQLFSPDDLAQAGIKVLVNDTLGLMQVVHSLTQYGYEPRYGFLHSSVRDFLCAQWMSDHLSEEEQVSSFKHLLHTNPTSLVLVFYAGITKLENKGVYECLKSIGTDNLPHDYTLVSALEASKSPGGDPRRLLLAYLHCFYEAQLKGILFNCTGVEPRISLSWYRFSIHDINVISFFMISMAKSVYPRVVHIDLNHCFIGDHGVQSIATSLMSQAPYSDNWKLGLALIENNFTHKCMKDLAALITSCHNIVAINIGQNFESSSGFIVLKSLIEALPKSNVKFLSLTGCMLESRHAYHLILLTDQVELLGLNSNMLRECVPYIVLAAKKLKFLSIQNVGLSNKLQMEVGVALQSNTSLLELHIGEHHPLYEHSSFLELVYDGPFGGFAIFIELITSPQSRSHLRKLYVVHHYKEFVNRERIKIAALRFSLQRGYPLFIVVMKDPTEGVFRNIDQLSRSLLLGDHK